MFRWIAPALLIATGCSEFNFHSSAEKEEDVPPAIEVSPMELVFSTLENGEEEVMQFRIDSVGETALDLMDVYLASGDSFEVVSEETSGILDPGFFLYVDVAFAPTEPYDHTGQVMVVSNDPENPEILVDLRGFGAVPPEPPQPMLEISPAAHDFGQTYIPCGDEVEVTLRNAGDADLEIWGIGFSGDAQLLLVDRNELPLVLEPDASTSVKVTYDAALEGPVSSELVVDSSDPRGLQMATQDGEGVFEATMLDEFEVPTNPPVDILFAVDQSCSMDDDASRLGSAFGEFISALDSVTEGWQVGVVTKDDGCFNEGILTSTTADYVGKFSRAVTVGEGWDTWTEALLKLSNIALDKMGAGQCNAGFLRPGALLHVIVVSDEPEQSGTAWGTHLADMAAHVSDPALVKVSAVADIYDTCGDGGAAGYREAADYTSGLALDICSAAWATRVDELAAASLVGLGEYVLSATPDMSTVEVYVDGQLWTEADGWEYDASLNAIILNYDYLEGGELVEVMYQLVSECE
jgi:hypothetical protein